MPRHDGTGPEGKGPLTGGRKGFYLTIPPNRPLTFRPKLGFGFRRRYRGGRK